MLIIPFALIKIQGIPITFNQYVITLKQVIGSHVISKLLVNFHEVSWEKRSYLITSLVFYGIQLYQNLLIFLLFICGLLGAGDRGLGGV